MVSTIGYERANLDDFIATLMLGGIEVLVDIRDRAQSRRPGFSKTALAEALHDAGIRYVHMRELGDPKEGREAARSGDFERFEFIFQSVLDSDTGKKAFRDLEELVIKQTVCLMCYERDQNTCHRKIVSDKLEKSLKIKATHLGVRDGVSRAGDAGRVRHSNQSAAA